MNIPAEERWLTEAYDYEPPQRGQILQGRIVKIEERGIAVDVGGKRDGFIPKKDLSQLHEEVTNSLKPGQEVKARVLTPEGTDGDIVLSLYQARRFERDWSEAQEMLDSEGLWQGKIEGHNRGGLIAKFGYLRAFVPASHLSVRKKHRIFAAQREEILKKYVGQELTLQVIEVDPDARRLILSERLARRQLREQNMQRLLHTLVEGDVCRGIVSALCGFGAFVDLGGADGLIHISELAWRRVRHPKEVVQVGDEVEVLVWHLDHERRRIGLSLKRLQPNPWALVSETYAVDQLVGGKVTNVVDFGVFVALPVGIEGLVHVSELADPPPPEPRELVRSGEELVLRILRIEPFRKRVALSLKRVSTQERDKWLEQLARGEAAQMGEDNDFAGDEETARFRGSD